MIEITPMTPVGQLVAQRPARSRVFEQFGIDFCCGGRMPLGEACAREGINTDDVVAALRQADARKPTAEEADWTRASLSELIANILDLHHTYLRRELPRLAQMTAKVHNAHGERHPEVVEVHRVFQALQAELESHMMKEEQVLFPMIQTMETTQRIASDHCGSVNNPIRVMEHEHDSAATALTRMRSLTGDHTPPTDACNTYRAMLDGLAELETDLHQHIHKENNILFPRAAELEAELSRTQPAGRH